MTKPYYYISTLEKALKILDAFDGPRVPLSPTDIAKRTGLGKQDVHRYLMTLRDLGMVSRDSERRFSVVDPMRLRLQLKMNGEVRQDSSTKHMLHDIASILERWSWVSLEPGDVIATGTPEGVALGGNEAWYLRPGDVMECIIEGLGTLRNPVVVEREVTEAGPRGLQIHSGDR